MGRTERDVGFVCSGCAGWSLAYKGFAFCRIKMVYGQTLAAATTAAAAAKCHLSMRAAVKL